MIQIDHTSGIVMLVITLIFRRIYIRRRMEDPLEMTFRKCHCLCCPWLVSLSQFKSDRDGVVTSASGPCVLLIIVLSHLSSPLLSRSCACGLSISQQQPLHLYLSIRRLIHQEWIGRILMSSALIRCVLSVFKSGGIF